MLAKGPAEVLHDRRVEREALERLLAAVRGARSRVLVVSGDPGVGKTALVESVIGSASGFWILRALGRGVGDGAGEQHKHPSRTPLPPCSQQANRGSACQRCN